LGSDVLGGLAGEDVDYGCFAEVGGVGGVGEEAGDE